MSKHEAMQEYLKDYVSSISDGQFGFNFISGDFSNVSFITQYADKDIKKYIRVGAIRAYGFGIEIARPYSSNTDDINLRAMELAQDFNDWIDTQGRNKAFPDFGDKCVS